MRFWRIGDIINVQGDTDWDASIMPYDSSRGSIHLRRGDLLELSYEPSEPVTVIRESEPGWLGYLAIVALGIAIGLLIGLIIWV
jgi:hypothetical protein